MESILVTLQNTSPAWLAGSVAVIALAAANAKALPFAYTLQLLPSIYRLLKPRLSRDYNRPGTKPSSPSDAHSRLFKHHVIHSRATISDLGLVFRKSNSTFFIDGDISRAELLTTLLSDTLAVSGPANFLLESVQCTFCADIRPYRAYSVSSRILAWNSKTLYIVTYFLRPGTELPSAVEVLGGPAAVLNDERHRGDVFAIMLSKHMLNARGTNISPCEILEKAGLLVLEGQKGKGGGRDEHVFNEEGVKKAVQNGFEYVSSCMG